MRARFIVLLILAASAIGCAQIKTKEIYFYRFPNINENVNIGIDVIYPQSEFDMNEIRKMTPEQWFDPDNPYRATAYRARVLTDQGDFKPCPEGLGDCDYVLTLDKRKKTRKQRWLIVMAQLGPPPEGSAAVPGQRLLIYLDKDEDPEKREHVRIHQGYIERLSRKPRGRRYR